MSETKLAQETAEVQEYEPISRLTSQTHVIQTKMISADSKDSLFEQFYKMNNRLRYCNGCYFKFSSPIVEQEYNAWKNSLSKSRSFDLYYGNGVVD